MNIYVASSWRNEGQPQIVTLLRNCGYEVYDFRNPKEDDHGFHWSDIDKGWAFWSVEHFREALGHQLAVDGFRSDFEALKRADFCLLVLPCGRSAHLELGWSVGAGKKTGILLANGEPELMYKMVDHLFVSVAELAEYFAAVKV